jgi:hypothetical protein
MLRLCGAILLVACCGALSCRTPGNVDDIARKLDRVGQKLDQYGSVSVSSPLFVDPRSADEIFQFDLPSKGPEEYYKDARTDVQGRAAALFQQASETRVGVQAQLDLQELILNRIKLERFRRAEEAYIRGQELNDSAEYLRLLLPLIDPALAEPASQPATQPGDTSATQPGLAPASRPAEVWVRRLNQLIPALESASTGMAGTTTQPTLPEFSKVETRPWAADLLPDTEAVRKQLIDEAKFQRFQELLAGLNGSAAQLVVPNRSAIITAAGDTAVEGIMRFLGRPELAEHFRDKVVLVGVSMVSCAPGTRTQRGYAADVSVAVSYDYQPVRQQVLAFLLDELKDPHALQLARVYLDLCKQNTWRANPELTENFYKRLALESEQTELGRKYHELPDSPAKDEVVKKLEDIASKLSKLESESAQLGLTAYASTLEKLIGRCKDEQYRRARRSTAPSSLAGKEETNLFDVDLMNGQVTARFGGNVPPAPTVAAVSPMTDVQTLDLASSLRQQQAFALRIALLVSGFGGEAQAAGVNEYIRQLQQDAATRTALNTVSGYSNSGGVFGYQIGPSFVGAAGFSGAGQAGSWRNPGPAMVLQRQSFPALVFVGIDRDDLRLKLRYDPGTDSWSIVEPRLQFRQTTRWIPLDSWLVGAPGGWFGPKSISEADRIRWANDLRLAMNAVDQLDLEHDTDGLGDVEPGANPYVLEDTPADAAFKDFVRSRIAVLHSHMLEAYHFQAVPLSAFVPPGYDLTPPTPTPAANSHSAQPSGENR